MRIKARALAIGVGTYVPGLRNFTGRKTGGSDSARYCYSVWLRHLSMLHRHGLPTTFDTVVELGPGDSLGVGMAALLSGAGRYVALDAVRYADNARNHQIFEELIGLFRNRTPIPDEAEFPLLQPALKSYAFPAEFLSSTRLEVALNPARLHPIRAALSDPGSSLSSKPICYEAPYNIEMIKGSTVDLIISQGALQFIDDLPTIYKGMINWLKSGGIMSHEIAFQSLGITPEWNGHWACSDALWRIAAGRRRHVTNREPHSTYIALLQQFGCRVVTDERTVRASRIGRAALAYRFRYLSDEDLETSSALIQAMKIKLDP